MNTILIVSIINDIIFQFTAKKLIQATSLVDQILQFPDGKEAIHYLKFR